MFSVAIPILLVEAAFPRIAGRPWVGRTGILVSIALPALLTAVTLLDPALRPQRLVVIALILLLIWLGLRRRPGSDRTAAPPRPTTDVTGRWSDTPTEPTTPARAVSGSPAPR